MLCLKVVHVKVAEATVPQYKIILGSKGRELSAGVRSSCVGLWLKR
jgi:hypothetical protein